MLFKEIIAVYSENHTKPINTKQLLIVEAGGTYIYHWALKGYKTWRRVEQIHTSR
jgi:hypothetical protein